MGGDADSMDVAGSGPEQLNGLDVYSYETKIRTSRHTHDLSVISFIMT